MSTSSTEVLQNLVTKLQEDLASERKKTQALQDTISVLKNRLGTYKQKEEENGRKSKR